MPRYRSLFLTLLIAAAPIAASAAPADFAGLVDIGGGRKMYLECRGAGVPADDERQARPVDEDAGDHDLAGLSLLDATIGRRPAIGDHLKAEAEWLCNAERGTPRYTWSTSKSYPSGWITAQHSLGSIETVVVGPLIGSLTLIPPKTAAKPSPNVTLLSDYAAEFPNGDAQTSRGRRFHLTCPQGASFPR